MENYLSTLLIVIVGILLYLVVAGFVHSIFEEFLKKNGFSKDWEKWVISFTWIIWLVIFVISIVVGIGYRIGKAFRDSKSKGI